MLLDFESAGLLVWSQIVDYS